MVSVGGLDRLDRLLASTGGAVDDVGVARQAMVQGGGGGGVDAVRRFLRRLRPGPSKTRRWPAPRSSSWCSSSRGPGPGPLPSGRTRCGPPRREPIRASLGFRPIMAIDGAEIADGGPAGLGPGLVGLDGGGGALAPGSARSAALGVDRAARRDQAAGQGGQRHRGVIEELAERRGAQLLLARRLLVLAEAELLPDRGRRRRQPARPGRAQRGRRPGAPEFGHRPGRPVRPTRRRRPAGSCAPSWLPVLINGLRRPNFDSPGGRRQNLCISAVCHLSRQVRGPVLRNGAVLRDETFFPRARRMRNLPLLWWGRIFGGIGATVIDGGTGAIGKSPRILKGGAAGCRYALRERPYAVRSFGVRRFGVRRSRPACPATHRKPETDTEDRTEDRTL